MPNSNSSSNPKTWMREKNSISAILIIIVYLKSRRLWCVFPEKKASPSPCGAASTSPAATPQQSRRASLLHPDHARLQLHHLHHNHHNSGVKNPPTPDRASIDEEPPLPPSPSSSTTSSIRSMPSSANAQMHSQDRRRSSR